MFLSAIVRGLVLKNAPFRPLVYFNVDRFYQFVKHPHFLLGDAEQSERIT